MDSNSYDPEKDYDASSNGPSLDILKDVQRAYEERMVKLDCVDSSRKLQMQVDVLRAWVDDLVGQNALLAQTVTDLEREATSALQRQRQRFIEMAIEHRAERSALQRRLRRKDADLRGLLEVLRRLRDFDYYTLEGIHFHEVTASDIFGPMDREMKTGGEKEQDLMRFSEALQKDNAAKEREVRRLNKELQKHEKTVLELQKEISVCRCNSTPIQKADADVMVGMSWIKQECGDMEPVRDRNLPIEEPNYQERIKAMDTKLKATSKNVRALRKANVTLSFELYATRCVCAALGEECTAAKMNANFKDDIVREMRRQLKQAKAKLSSTMDVTSLKPVEFEAESAVSFDSETTGCIREQPHQLLADMTWPQPRAFSDTDCRSSRYGE